MNYLHISFGFSSSLHSSSTVNNGSMSVEHQGRCVIDARSPRLSFSSSFLRVRSLDVSLMSGRQKVTGFTVHSWIARLFLAFPLHFYNPNRFQTLNNYPDELGEIVCETSLSVRISEASNQEFLQKSPYALILEDWLHRRAA